MCYMSDELSFESKKHVKLVVESLQHQPVSIRLAQISKLLEDAKKKRTIEQLKEISKYGLY